MLGHHPILERELRKKGRRALAKVLEAHKGHFAEAHGNLAADQIATTKVLWKLVLQVEPEGEPPFEARLEAMLHEAPSVGGELPVLYDPNDHTKVIIDQSEEGEQSLVNRQIEEHADDLVSRMRARGQDQIADRYKAVYDAGLLTNWSNDPAELHKQIEERREQIRETMAGPNVLIGGQPVAPGGPPMPASGPANAAATADALTKLADLRDRGVLTDEEFQEQKKKLLGG